MYFHTQEQGLFIFNLGRLRISYPFSKKEYISEMLSQNQSSLDNEYQYIQNQGEVKNVFFNIEENSNTIEDRMLILLQINSKN